MGSRSRNRLEVDVDHIEALSHTQGYDVDEYLVTRRDTTFPVNLKTRAKLTVEDATLIYDKQNQVSLKLGKQTSPTSIEVTIPADTPVTVYTLNVKGRFDNGEIFDEDLGLGVVVLFNAWSKNDTVYMENPEWCDEYVLNPQGIVYVGDLDGTPWNLGLHRPDSLRAVIFLLERNSRLSFDQKRSPVLISREMSALINSVDDDGVLVGRWDGNYSDGRSPSSWRGSGQILQQYYRSGGEPVKYGQCWVFSGVLMSVLRLFGIPSRSVTNFSSAHDTNCNRNIDNYYNEDGEKVRYLDTGSDSIWNFHVWNEAYMARPDLPAGYDGWQALDATPQEESPQGGGYKTGPAPLKAIKDGNSVDYDANFIISEVNADIKKYIIGRDGVPRLCRVDTSTVGRDISTKAIGCNGREDITHRYKYTEGTEKERRSLLKGIQQPVQEPEEVIFEIPQGNFHFGDNVVFVVKATSKERQHRVRGMVQCEAIAYTGRLLKEVATLKVDKKINRGKTEVIQMTVGGDIFSEFPGTKVYLRFNVTLPIVGTHQVFAETITVSPTPPTLKISGPDKVGLGQEATITCSFTNPLPVPMHDIIFNVDADELFEEDLVHPVGTLNPRAELTCAFDVTGLKVGTHSIVVGLDCDKTEMITAKKDITVEREGPPPVEPPFRPIGDLNKIEVDTIFLNLPQNHSAHYTERYDYDGLIVRRGQPFTLTLTTKDPLPTGAKVATRAVFKLLSKKLSRPYIFEVEAVSFAEGNTLELELKPPANVAIGEYELLLNFDNKGTTTSFNGKIKLALLFNPWCKEDTCHYPEADHLEEYVLNNRGRIWKGSARSGYGAPWQFAQFKKESLEVTLYIMDQLSVEKRGDPVQVARHLSALVNSSDDDNGILVGDWSGNYSGGTAPTDWTGSAEIMAEYNQTKRSVCFGQCWVFSGVMTTMLRCLGVPARSVTNFNSAHDTDANRSIDRYFDEFGDRIPHNDSLWNFHVWNEAYMARPDLPAGFGGWQVLDATPQEESPQGGGYRLGPCPQRAVKLGQRMNYDTEFVISEVNADLCYYTVHSDGRRTLDKVHTAIVGKNISTKAIGSHERHDLTDDYKFREGSAAERATLLAETEAEKEIGVELTLDDDVVIGEDFIMKTTITNKGAATKEFLANLHGRAVLYTGAPGQVIKSLKNVSISLYPGESKTIELPVKDSDYLRILEGGNLIDFVAMVTQPADRLSVVDTDTLRLKTPDIAIALPEGGLKLYQPATINVSFTNPLSKRLTGGKFSLHGEGYLNDVAVEVSSVSPNRVASASLQTFPVKTGSFELVVRFSSNQLTDILGDEDVEVVAA